MRSYQKRVTSNPKKKSREVKEPSYTILTDAPGYGTVVIDCRYLHQMELDASQVERMYNVIFNGDE